MTPNRFANYCGLRLLFLRGAHAERHQFVRLKPDDPLLDTLGAIDPRRLLALAQGRHRRGIVQWVRRLIRSASRLARSRIAVEPYVRILDLNGPSERWGRRNSWRQGMLYRSFPVGSHGMRPGRSELEPARFPCASSNARRCRRARCRPDPGARPLSRIAALAAGSEKAPRFEPPAIVIPRRRSRLPGCSPGRSLSPRGTPGPRARTGRARSSRRHAAASRRLSDPRARTRSA